MSSSTAQLKVVNTTAARKGGVKAHMSPDQAASAAQLAMLSQTYTTLTREQQQTFVNICKVCAVATQGKNAFVALNTVRIQNGDDLLTVCPDFPDVIAALPTVTMEAYRVGGPYGSFVLDLHSDTYSGRVQLWGTRSLSPGRQSVSVGEGQFKLLDVITGLSAGTTTMTNQYLSRFLAPAAGTSVALKLVPVGPNGFKGIYQPLMERVIISASDLTVSE